MRPTRRRRLTRHHALRLCATAAATSAALALTAAAPAQAQSDLPVNTHFASGALQGFATPTEAPPGANDWGCRPSAAHPDPVVLVHGTFGNMNSNWRGAAPLLADNGYCVFAFTYGGSSPDSVIQGVGPLTQGADVLAGFVDRVLAATGAGKVDLVAHSQGGAVARYYTRFLGGAGKVRRIVGLSPSGHGTTLDGLTEIGSVLHLLKPVDALLNTAFPALVDQQVGSPFLTRLNAGGDTVPGISYTTVVTRYDEVVTPYRTAYLDGPDVTNITVQDQCAVDFSDHFEIAYDPVALTDVLNALDPAHPRALPCEVVLPLTGPLH